MFETLKESLNQPATNYQVMTVVCFLLYWVWQRTNNEDLIEIAIIGGGFLFLVLCPYC